MTHYHVFEEISRGGMGIVYSRTRPALGELCSRRGRGTRRRHKGRRTRGRCRFPRERRSGDSPSEHRPRSSNASTAHKKDKKWRGLLQRGDATPTILRWGTGCGRSFSTVRHDVHHPDVAQVLFPREVEELPVRVQSKPPKLARATGQVHQRVLGTVIHRQGPQAGVARVV